MSIAIAVSQDPSNLPTGERALLDALRESGEDATSAVWSSDGDWTRFAAVVVRSCWDYHLRIDEFLAWIARLEELSVPLINSAELIRWNADKRYLADLRVERNRDSRDCLGCSRANHWT